MGRIYRSVIADYADGINAIPTVLNKISFVGNGFIRSVIVEYADGINAIPTT